MAADVDARIAAFIRAGRRRKVIAFAAGGVVSVLLGLAALVVAIYAHDDRSHGRDHEAGVLGLACIISGVGLFWKAYRIARRQIDDAEVSNKDPLERVRFL